jgi:hypothetical protein
MGRMAAKVAPAEEDVEVLPGLAPRRADLEELVTSAEEEVWALLGEAVMRARGEAEGPRGCVGQEATYVQAVTKQKNVRQIRIS